MTLQILNNRLSSLDSLPLSDPAIQYGAAGFFETLRVERGAVCLLDPHLRRLYASLEAFALAPPPEDLLLQAIREAIGGHPPTADLRLRITVGPAPDALPASPTPASPSIPNSHLAASPLAFPHPADPPGQPLMVGRDYAPSPSPRIPGAGPAPAPGSNLAPGPRPLVPQVASLVPGPWPPAPISSRAWISAEPLPDAYCGPLDRRPAFRALVFEDYRFSSAHPLAGHKNRQYWLYAEARRRAAARGFDEAIVLNERGELVEASAFNLFWIAEGRLIAPAAAAGGLPGVFAARVRMLARRASIPVEEVQVPADALLNGEAAFLTNSTAEIVGLSAIAHGGSARHFALREHPLGKTLLDLAEADRSPRADWH